MTGKTAFCTILALSLSAGPVFAVDRASTAKIPLDFELSDGHRFITLSSLPAMPTVVNFWRADCPPCLREMPELAALARSGQARVITVALQRPTETAAAPAEIQAVLRAPLLVLHGPSEPRGLLARFGNRIGALPHTVILDTGRRACAQRTGEINRQWLAASLTACDKS
ncbi:TlpA disulfide reductase family protein [Azonexus sp.]|uniref:TlpA family protein disulfide reductase n=1 Tax=Azonexus sp. TaxID=1872668 RepID=UPI0027B9BA9F|nr:TlpA disulfide reductase family protein [Azonexus sp.]